jgi:glycosyltransferase involved in cell wall biosynthesis
MVFDGKYFNWNQKRINGILDFYGSKFFQSKKILDLGCGYGDVGGSFHRLGADVTLLDARQEHLKVASKRYPGTKIIRADLDTHWPFQNNKFDIVLDLDLLCHLSDYEYHLRKVCSITDCLILETSVCDHDDPFKAIKTEEDKSSYDLSVNGVGSIPTASAIERVLSESGMDFKRIDSANFNSGQYKYDWIVSNDGNYNLNKRRLWFCTKSANASNKIIPIVPKLIASNLRALSIKESLLNAKSLLKDISSDNDMEIIPNKILNINHNKEDIPPKINHSNKEENVNESNSNKEISIIIPAFEASEFLEECLTSISKQMNNINYEILLGVDFCLDTLNWIIKNHHKFNNIKYFWFKENVGPYIIKNTLVDFAGSDNILFFDADDIMAPTMIEDFIKNIKTSTIIKFKYCDFNNSSGINKPLPNKWYGEGVFGIKKSFFEKLNGFEGWRCAADTEFHLRAKYNKIISKNIPNVSFYRRLHSKNLTIKSSTKYGSSIRQNYIKIINQKTRTNKWTLDKKNISHAEVIDIGKLSSDRYHHFMLNIFNSKYFYNKNILIFSDNSGEMSENISNLGGKINILYLNEKPVTNQKIKTNILSINELLKNNNRFDVALFNFNTDNLELLQKYTNEIYKKSTELIIYQDSPEIERILLNNKINFIKLLSGDNNKNVYFCSKRAHVIKEINKKYINKQNITNKIETVSINDSSESKIFDTNINFQVYHTIPWDTSKNIGKCYNQFMSLLQDEDWACFLDGDAVHTTSFFGKNIEQVIASNQDYGLFTCYTNRIGCSYQIPSGANWNNDSQNYHRDIGKKLWEKYKTNILDITNNSPLSGVLILINKDKWSQVGGFKEEKMLSIDNDIHMKFKAAGFKVGLMKGIYVQHWYRNGIKQNKSHLI